MKHYHTLVYAMPDNKYQHAITIESDVKDLKIKKKMLNYKEGILVNHFYNGYMTEEEFNK